MMMQSNYQIFGNSLWQWLGLFSVLFFSVLAGRITVWRLGRTVRRMLGEKESATDEMLVQALETPLFLVLILCGVWVGFSILSVSPDLAGFFGRAWKFSLTLAVSWTIVRVYEVFHAAYLVRRIKDRYAYLDDQFLSALGMVVKSIIWILGILLAFNNLGYDVTALAIGIALAGLAVALAAQDTIASLFGGVTLFAQQPFKNGDLIDVDGFRGKVYSIGLRITTLVDEAGQTLQVPNKYFSQSPVRTIDENRAYLVVNQIPLSLMTQPGMLSRFIDFLSHLADKNPDLQKNVRVSLNGFTPSAIVVELVFEIKPFTDADKKKFLSREQKIAEVRSKVLLEILFEMQRRRLKFGAATNVPDNLERM